MAKKKTKPRTSRRPTKPIPKPISKLAENQIASGAKNNSSRNRLFIFMIVATIVVVVVALAVMSLDAPRTQISQDGSVLSAVEVREYEGERLSSVNDFRENSIKGVQYVDIEDYMLEITGLVDNPVSLSYDDVTGMTSYQKVVTLHCVEGWSATILWEGVKLSDIIGQAGTQIGANTVIFHAYDGYSSSLPLDYIIDNDILLAYKMNDAPLIPARGFPFQVVAEEKWGYKWVKWVTKIELSNDHSFKGYWEARGYNNNGDLSGPKFG